MSASQKLTLACTKREAEAIGAVEIDGVSLVTTEEDEVAERWRLDAYFDGRPDPAALAAVRALVAAPGDTLPEPVPDEDWVTLSQAGLQPIREGRFVVHTAAHAESVTAAPPPGGRAFLIEAGQAFGTGHHETTAGCLAMLETLADEPHARIVDLGTGTGLLAFAAQALWPDAQVLATDIDPVAIAVTRENKAANAINGIDLLVADGARGLAAGFDLVIANILAGPLIAMTADIAAAAAPGAAILLAGLLSIQADDVLAAYAARGCEEERRLVRGDWTILLLRAGDRSAGRMHA